MRLHLFVLTLSLGTLACSDGGVTQQAGPLVPTRDSIYIDAQGRAHFTNAIPLPKTISPQEAQYLARPLSDSAPNRSLAQKRAQTDAMQLHDSTENPVLYPVNIAFSKIVDIPVRTVTPIDPIPANKANRVLVNLHGGGFTTDSGSLTESIPIDNLAHTKVVAVLYRLAPEHPFSRPLS